MVELGYKLSSEEHAPNNLVANARRAEEVGFSFGMISDHFHPWVDKQGQAPFVWSVIGGIAQATQRLSVVTGVTCPTVRTHPAPIMPTMGRGWGRFCPRLAVARGLLCSAAERFSRLRILHK